MDKVGCLVVWVALLVGCLGGSVLTVDMAEVVNKIRVTSGFVFHVMFVGCLGVKGACTLQLSCGA